MTTPSISAEADRPIMVIDIGGTNVKFGYSVAGLPHPYHRLFGSDALRDGDPIPTLASMVDTVRGEAGLRPSVIVATVPGFIDTDFDRVLFAGNVQTLNGRCLATELRRLVDCPVLLERDAVLALTGEVVSGSARGADHVLGIFFGTGIGAAYIAGGVPFRGGGWALEIGHMPFRGEQRTLAGLRTDSLEAYCSGRALQELAIGHCVTIGDVFARENGTALADELALFVRDQAFAVGTGIALFSPRTIVLGGGVLESERYPRARLLQLIADHAPATETGRALDLRWAELGWAAALHGAPRVVAEHSARSRAVALAAGPDDHRSTHGRANVLRST